MKLNNNIFIGINHLFQLDCVMIRKLDDINSFNKEELIKMILIMFYSFKSYDFVDYLISLMDKKFGTNYIQEYREISKSLKILKKY